MLTQQQDKHLNKAQKTSSNLMQNSQECSALFFCSEALPGDMLVKALCAGKTALLSVVKFSVQSFADFHFGHLSSSIVQKVTESSDLLCGMGGWMDR